MRVRKEGKSRKTGGSLETGERDRRGERDRIRPGRGKKTAGGITRGARIPDAGGMSLTGARFDRPDCRETETDQYNYAARSTRSMELLMGSDDNKERRIAEEKRRKEKNERRQEKDFAWLEMMERRKAEEARRRGPDDRRNKDAGDGGNEEKVT